MKNLTPSRTIDLNSLTLQDELYIIGCADAGSNVWCRDTYNSDKGWMTVITLLANSPYASEKQQSVAWGIIKSHKNKATSTMKRQLVRQRRAAFQRDHAAKVLAMLDRGDLAVCSECGATDDLTIDHITPLSRGGTDDIDNLRFLCQSCNSKKGALSPVVQDAILYICGGV